MNGIFIFLGVVLFVIILILGIIFLNFLGLWIQAKTSGAAVTIFGDLLGMWLRKVPRRLIVNARITAVKAGIEISVKQLEAHYLAGGNVMDVVKALIAAKRPALTSISTRPAPSIWPLSEPEKRSMRPFAPA
jgi:uncharacterized protein YqfA (UPF0365 family)